MGKYRKKPVVIEAKQLTGSKVGDSIAAWCGGYYTERVKPSDSTDVVRSIAIPTLEGTMVADCGDWIIRGVKGEFYPCKPDIFDATYDEVE